MIGSEKSLQSVTTKIVKVRTLHPTNFDLNGMHDEDNFVKVTIKRPADQKLEGYTNKRKILPTNSNSNPLAATPKLILPKHSNSTTLAATPKLIIPKHSNLTQLAPKPKMVSFVPPVKSISSTIKHRPTNSNSFILPVNLNSTVLAPKPKMVPFLPPVIIKSSTIEHPPTPMMALNSIPLAATPLVPVVKNQRKGFGRSKNMNQKKEPRIYSSVTPKQNLTGK